MSFENKNLFHLLGNDVEDEEAPILATREVVRNKTSSKKADVPPASADPAKAKKKSKPSGNEGALKSKLNNKSVAGPASTPTKHYKKPFDRHSRTGKTDSGKKIKQGWGSDDKRELEDETAAVEDAADELNDSTEEGAEASVPKRSLQDYFAELTVKQQELEGQKKIRQANEGAESKWTAAEKLEKAKAEFIAGSVNKKGKAKAPKEKKFLDFEAKFEDGQQSSSPRAPREGGNRGGRGGFQKRGGNSSGFKSSKKPVVNDKNFPSL